jgi:hypothetical protein
MDILEFKDLTFGCNITDKEGLRVYKVVGFDSKKGSVDLVHHLDKVTASLSNYKGIKLSNEVLNTCDIELVSENLYNIGELTFSSIFGFKYLHQIQRSYLAETNEVLEYKPIV